MAKTKGQKCEVRTHLACTGMAVRRMTGTKKGDPVFNCCYGCEVYLRRQGVRMKEAGLITKRPGPNKSARL